MEYYVGLEVPAKRTAICVVGRDGRLVREAALYTEPETLAAFLRGTGLRIARVGLDAGLLPYRELDDALGLAYNLGNFLHTLVLTDAVEYWSLTILREKLIKIGAKVVRHGRHITFQMVEVAIPKPLFVEILRLIEGLRPAPLPP